jgi:hypothetical protein
MEMRGRLLCGLIFFGVFEIFNLSLGRDFGLGWLLATGRWWHSDSKTSVEFVILLKLRVTKEKMMYGK